MTVKRKIDTKTLRPGGIDGEEHADQVSESVNALWETSGGILTSVGGSANLITANLKYSTDFAAYTEPLVCKFKAVASNTGSVQVNLNGLGAKFVKRVNGDALIAGDILINVWYSMFYSATDDVFIISQIGSPTLPSTQNVKQIWTQPLYQESITGPNQKVISEITGVTADVGDVILVPRILNPAEGTWNNVTFNDSGSTLTGVVEFSVHKNGSKLWNIATVDSSLTLGDAEWNSLSFDTAATKHFNDFPYAILVDDTNENDYSVEVNAFNGSCSITISYAETETWKHIKSTVTI